MTIQEAVEIITKNPVMVQQVKDLLPSSFEDSEVDRFLIEFAEASLEV